MLRRVIGWIVIWWGGRHSWRDRRIYKYAEQSRLQSMTKLDNECSMRTAGFPVLLGVAGRGP